VEDTLFNTFAEVEDRHWWFLARREIVCAVAQRVLPVGSSVLDLGCGTGFVLERLQERYCAHGLDISPLALDLCRKRGLSQVWLGSSEDLSAVDGSRFQGVFLLDVLEHLDDDTEALRQISEVLAPGGSVIITVPAFMFLWSRHDEINQHRRRYTRRTLADLLHRSGFQIEQLSYFNSFLFPLAAAARVAGGLLGRYAPGGLGIPPAPLNELLRRIFLAESSRLIRPNGARGFPFGVSLLAVGRWKDARASDSSS
jgi:SAM-dependent methyltransferase